MARFGSHVGSLQEIDRLRHKLLCLSIILELCLLFLKHDTDSLSFYTERFDLIIFSIINGIMLYYVDF